jgi:hypothetical protein
MRRLLLPLAAAALALAGCRADPNRTYPVEVSVTLDGKPLKEGVLYFFPADGRGPAGGEVKDGTLAFAAVAGAHHVEVRAYRLLPGAKAPPGAKPGQLVPDPFVNYLPERYNASSTLTAEVRPEGPNAFSYRLTSDEPR